MNVSGKIQNRTWQRNAERSDERDQDTLKKNCRIVFLLLGIFLSLSLGLPANVRAGLDGNQTQIREDAQKMGLVPGPASTQNGYSTVTLSLPATSPQSMGGRKTLTVREFSDAGGTIFAIAWEGSLPPDLSVLLGDRFSSVPKKNSSPYRHQLFVRTPDLRVRVIGTARFRAGKAWIPSRLPPGFNPDQIRVQAP